MPATEASLAGIPVGKGSRAIDITEDQFSALRQRGSSGILKAFAGGQGTGASQGRIVNGQLVPANYVSTLASTRSPKPSGSSSRAATKDSTIEPEPPPSPDRIPVIDAHRRGVIDPMTGLTGAGDGNRRMLGLDACKSNASIFDGRMRYDLRLDYKRLETVKVKGLSGQRSWSAVIISRRSRVTFLTGRRSARCRAAR